MPGIEDRILDKMINENIGFSEYSQMDEYGRATTSKPIYKMFKDQYLGRSMQDYGRLSFEDYIGGMTPEEGYITSLGSEVPTPEAIAWSEKFGEDTDLMKQAAFDYGKAYDGIDYPNAKNSYRQGE